MITLVIATRNDHKVAEIRAILGAGFRYFTLKDFPDALEVIEDQPTFAGNAAKKSRELAAWLQTNHSTWVEKHSPAYVLADDSGLEVDAINGAPGVHSARFAALDSGAHGNSATADNNAKLLRLMEKVSDDRRSARFHCVIALSTIAAEAGAPGIFDGVCEGRIGRSHKGQGGFGYDPLFIPEGFDETFAELGDSVKNRLSHRGRALEKLQRWLAAQ